MCMECTERLCTKISALPYMCIYTYIQQINVNLADLHLICSLLKERLFFKSAFLKKTSSSYKGSFKREYFLLRDSLKEESIFVKGGSLKEESFFCKGLFK